jgi:NADH:ubiquinone oxidoreductase subunit 5 (subunit L)/multisubunit Na+/H+ antiporter MnhA subunit
VIAMTGAFFGASVIAYPLVRLLGRSGFFLLALVPLTGLLYSLSTIPDLFSPHAQPLVESLDWLPALGLEGVFRLDVLSWIMTLLVTGIGALVFVYCARYFPPDEPGLARFAGIFMAFAAMMYGLVIADELLMLYLFWEGTTVFSYLLIGHSQSRRRSRQAALQALIVTTAGGLAMLVGMVLLITATGTGRISALVDRAQLGMDTGPVIISAIILILIGAISKSALMPFHFWLPGAMAAPTPVSAYLHAAAMVKAGIYLVLRLAPGYNNLPGWSEVLLTLGLLTMFIGGWQALKQTDLKLLLAFGTVSQLGFLTTMASFGTPDITKAALGLLIAHALFKSCLFLCVGIIDHRAGTRDLTKLSGGWKAFPVVAVCATIAAASMAGLPPMFGFVAKEAVYSTLLTSPDKATVIAFIGIMIGSILTVAYSARFVWGRLLLEARRRRHRPPRREAHARDLPAAPHRAHPGSGPGGRTPRRLLHRLDLCAAGRGRRGRQLPPGAVARTRTGAGVLGRDDRRRCRALHLPPTVRQGADDPAVGNRLPRAVPEDDRLDGSAGPVGHRTHPARFPALLPGRGLPRPGRRDRAGRDRQRHLEHRVPTGRHPARPHRRHRPSSSSRSRRPGRRSASPPSSSPASPAMPWSPTSPSSAPPIWP